MNTAKSAQGAPASPTMHPTFYTIGDLSREFDVSLRALRFYEGRDLLHPQRRGNARHYSAQDRTRLQIILKGKKLGFTLAEIHDMVRSNEHNDVQLALNAEQVKAQIDHLERQRRDLDVAIIELQATHVQLAGGKKFAAA